MKPQLSEIRLETLPVKEANPAPLSQWVTKGGADFQVFFLTHMLHLTVYLPGESKTFTNRRAAWMSGKMKHLLVNLLDSLSQLFSGLPVALKKKQPSTSQRAPFWGHY